MIQSIENMDISFSLTQLVIFVSVADHGSFSAAARALGKAQSAVSHAIGQLESHLGVSLFDRTGRTPRLTDAGRKLLEPTRSILKNSLQLQESAEEFGARRRVPSFSLVVDMIFPADPLVEVIAALKNQFPDLSLSVHTEARGTVTARLLDETCQLGVTGVLLANIPAGIESLAIGSIGVVAVVSPEHPLAQLPDPVPLEVLRHHTQLVLDDRSQLSTDRQVGVIGINNWKIGSQSAKHRFLLSGFGWGAMPIHRVNRDLKAGTLVCFRPASWSEQTLIIPIHIIYRNDRPLNRVARAAVSLLKSAGERLS